MVTTNHIVDMSKVTNNFEVCCHECESVIMCDISFHKVIFLKTVLANKNTHDSHFGVLCGSVLPDFIHAVQDCLAGTAGICIQFNYTIQ